MKLLIMGAQGAGKGTAAEQLSKIYNIPTISTGDLFRAIVKTDSDLARKVKGIIEKGELVPDELTLSVLQDRLEKDDCQNGYILDGFPRTLDQAKMLETITSIDKVIFLEVEKAIVLERIAGRRTCPKCSHIHNIKYPGDPEYCSECGTKYIIRADDTPEAIEKRLATFATKTLPIVDYYKQKGLVLSVDSNVSPQATIDQIFKGLGK